MASGQQEKSLNESKTKFSVTEAFSSAGQFLANQISTDKCKQILSGFHSLLFYRSNTGFGNISLPLLWDLKQHVQFGVLCLLFPVTISIDQRENLPTALGLVLFKRKNLWTLFAICHLDRSLLTEKNSCWLKCLMLRPNKIREGNISLHIPEQFMVYDNHWITSIKSVFPC